ncbi:glycosyltransferase family A protein [Leucobacter iarius]|uniref:glycosyltransferase family 2 protein n=1 Tax=Leucobacter iarius TaxID=333963 RepID=UPI0031E2D29E
MVMPARNVGAWISEAVTSVLTQTMTSLELIVVDDGSDDDTLEILAGFDDPRLIVTASPASGGGTARNYGVTLARGRYLAFADGDDLVPERAYEALVAQARRTGAEMVVANYVIFSPTTLNDRNQWFPRYGRTREGVVIADEPVFLRDRVCWNRVFLRDSWNAAGIRFADSPRSNDIQAMTDAYCAFAFDVIPETVYMYRRRAGGSSMTARKNAPESILAHFEQELGCLASVTALQDPHVFARYSEHMLNHDVWAHIGPLLDPANVSDPAYDAPRAAMRQFILRTLPAGKRALSPVRRAVYALAEAERWAAAAAIASVEELAEEGVRHDAASVMRHLRSSGLSRSDAAVEALRISLLSPLRRHSMLDDAALESALREARAFARAHVPTRTLSRRERHILATSPSAGALEIRDRIDSAPYWPSAPERMIQHALRDAKAAVGIGDRAMKKVGREAARSTQRASRKLPAPVVRAARKALGRERDA